MNKELIYEGKAKKLYKLEDKEGVLLQEFKDDATAFNAEKKGQIKDKGVLNNKITTILYEYLTNNGIPTHFIEKISDNEMYVKQVDIVKVEVVCRNYAAGSLVKRYGLEEGKKLSSPIIEYYYKDDALGDPLFTPAHIKEMGLANDEDLAKIDELALKINGLLTKFFEERGILLVDFKLEFGKDADGNIILADEISPDTCRLWDIDTHKKLDKDRFRFDLGEVEEAYWEIYNRISN